MADIFNPLWVMHCNEIAPSNVPDPVNTVTRHQTIGTVNWKKGDVCRGIICYTPMGSKYATWYGTPSKCSAIGFIAYEGNWVKSYSYCHSSEQAYREVLSTVCNTFEFTVGEDYSNVQLGVYCIIQNGWANGYDNQFIFVHSIQVDILRGSSIVFQYHKYSQYSGYMFQAALNWRKNNRNYTVLSMYSSGSFLMACALDISTATGQWQTISACVGENISGTFYYSTYLPEAGPRLVYRRTGGSIGLDNAFWVGLRIHYTSTPIYANTQLVSYTVTFDIVESLFVASPRFKSVYYSLHQGAPEREFARPRLGHRTYSILSGGVSTGRNTIYIWVYLPSGAPVVAHTLTPTNTASTSGYIDLRPSLHFMSEYL